MAVYTLTLSRNNTGSATYYAGAIYYNTSKSSRWWSDKACTIEIWLVGIPKWNNGRKAFDGYWYGSTQKINSGGLILATSLGGNNTVTEKWITRAPAAVINANSGNIASEIVYDGGVWYQDYENRAPFDADHPITAYRECCRFLGCYSTNNTSGTQYVDNQGRPTAAFLALTPSEDFPIYAQWEIVSNKVTINASYGTFDFKTFYQSKTADGDGKYGYYSDNALTTRIYGIPVPTRELYAWDGLRYQSSATSALYADENGTFTQTFKDLQPPSGTNTRTVYGNFWTQVSYKITVNANGGSVSVAAYYTSKTIGNVYADWLCATTALDSLPIPVRAGYRFLGYFSASSGGTQLVGANGVISSTLKAQKATDTIYAQWRKATCVITLNANGGIGGGTLYYDSTAGDSAFFGESSASVSSITPPTFYGNTFVGYFSELTGGTMRVDEYGVIQNGWTPSSNETVYARWNISVCVVDVDAGEGTPGTERFWYNRSTGTAYADENLTQILTRATLPVLRMFDCLGLYDEADTQVVDAQGNISTLWYPEYAEVTLHAEYERRCYEVALDATGGVSSSEAIYRATSGSTWYSDDTLTTAVSSVPVPTRQGYTFNGYAYGGNVVVDANGSILSAAAENEDYIATASWTASQYTLTFDGNGGSPGFGSKAVTFGQRIGQLPGATWSRHQFKHWKIDEDVLTSSTVWNYTSDKTAHAEWKSGFGDLNDFFNADGARLMLVDIDSGEGRRVTNLWNGAYEQGGKLKNPVCTYRVKSAGTVGFTLGHCYGSYFLIGVEYVTGADKEPKLILRGMANEGHDAINLYTVTFRVDPDHTAQDPLGAVYGGGELVDCTTTFGCDPAVAYENSAPCASDICHGRVSVSATTAAYLMESAPTGGGGFIETSAPEIGSDVDFTTYKFAAERSL